MTSLRELSHDGAVRECLLTQLTPPPHNPRVDPTCLANARSTSDSGGSSTPCLLGFLQHSPFLQVLGFSSGSSRSLRAERAVALSPPSSSGACCSYWPPPSRG